MRQSGVSGKFDLGAEYGMPDIPQAIFWSHFSPNFQPSTIKLDDDVHYADFDSSEPEERDYLFKHMLSVAAVLHIIDTCTGQLHSAFAEWEAFVSLFSCVSSLLSRECPRQAFVHRVLRNGGFDHYAVHFDMSFDGMVEHR